MSDKNQSVNSQEQGVNNQETAPTKPIKWLWWVLGIMLLGAIGYGGWYLWQNQKSTIKNPMPTGRQENDISKLKDTEIETPITVTPSTPTAEEPTTTAPDPTADWKTYENKDYGFSFKYPEDFTPSERSKGVDGLFTVDVDYPTGGLTRSMMVAIYNDTIENKIKWVESLGGYRSSIDEKIADLSWKKFIYDPKDDANATDQSKGKLYLIEKDNKTYRISTDYDIPLEDYTLVETNIIIDQILSTFKFTD